MIPVTEILFRWKFWSRTNFFRKKLFHPEQIFLKKRAGADNFVLVYTLLKIDCKKLYDAQRGRSAQNEAQNNCLIVNPIIDSNNSIQCKVVWKHKCILAICLLKYMELFKEEIWMFRRPHWFKQLHTNTVSTACSVWWH